MGKREPLTVLYGVFLVKRAYLASMQIVFFLKLFNREKKFPLSCSLFRFVVVIASAFDGTTTLALFRSSHYLELPCFGVFIIT